MLQIFVEERKEEGMRKTGRERTGKRDGEKAGRRKSRKDHLQELCNDLFDCEIIK